MKLVFLVSEGSYSNYGVDSAWTEREKAEARVEHLKKEPCCDDPRIEEFYLDDPEPEDCDLWHVYFSADFKGATRGIETRASVERIEHIGRVCNGEFRKWRPDHRDPSVEYVIGGTVVRADDEASAIKVAAERRAAWAAANGGRL